MEELVKGSIETLPVEIFDRLGAISSLDGFTVQYMITAEDGTEVVTWSACNSNVMRALPIIDLTSVDVGIYNLYIKVDIAPEHPIVGPFQFMVV